MNNTLTYENAAPTWDRKILRMGYLKAYAGFFESYVRASGTLLDVGTGTGAFALSWIDAGGSSDVTLLDPSKSMLNQAKVQFARRGIQPKTLNCGFEDFSSEVKFDTILASHVLEHFDDAPAVMCQLARNLYSGGRLYLVVSKPHWCNWMIWLRFRHRWFDRETICKMAKAAGLKELRVHAFSAGPPSRTSLGYIFSKP